LMTLSQISPKPNMNANTVTITKIAGSGVLTIRDINRYYYLMLFFFATWGRAFILNTESVFPI
jgi:hypothetical protein